MQSVTTTSLEDLIDNIWVADAVPDSERLTFETIGLAAESGELLNQFKKHRFYLDQDRRAEILDELCDVYYHVNSLCKALDVTRESLEKQTIEKHTRSLAKIQERMKHSDEAA